MSNSGAIFISGSSSGIGEACAVGLDKRGYEVFAGVRSMKDGESLRRKTSQRLHPVLLDISKEEQIKAAGETVRQALGDTPLVGLINNAGIFVGGPLEFVPIERLRHQLEINLIGHIAVCQAFLPLLRQTQGRIINIGSVAGIFASPLMGPYCASKFAMEAVSDVLRRELRPWNIKVILLEPGIIATKIWQKAITQAEEAIPEAPDEMTKLYGPLLDAVHDHAADVEKTAQSPEVVFRAVIHALTAQRPKIRYRMGPRARVQKVISWLPDGIQDRILAAFLKWGNR
ncbi:MAG: SDR family NAD(P)-dependent oxidoreductase [Desulfobacterales bacterium]|jgi:NAD(P)-dependent dehydrogenase (short-subunit alcohol dehydrogenase family)